MSNSNDQRICDSHEKYLREFFYENRVLKKLTYLSLSLRKAKKLYDTLIISSPDISLKQKKLSYIVRLLNRSKVFNYYIIAKGYRDDLRLILMNGFFRSKKYISGHYKSYVDLSITLIIKNEAPYMKEWLDFHFEQGVKRVHIFDNGSTDNIREILNPYIDASRVVYMPYPGDRVQQSSYRYALARFGKYTKWMAFLDADEFLFSVAGKPLPEILDNYIDYPGVAVNWVVYGPCGHEKKPEGGLIENFKDTFEDKNNDFNLRIKSIVRPSEIISVPSGHYCMYRRGQFAVDEKYIPVDGSAGYIPGKGLAFTLENNRDILRINHYWTKSLEEFKNKCQRGYPDGNVNPDYDLGISKFDYPLIEDDVIINAIQKT